MGLTLRQAAEQAGVSRSTIHRAVKSGKLSGHRAEDGSWSIDMSELARVFPWDVSEQPKSDAVEQPRDSETVLAVKVAMLEQQLAREQETVNDLRKRLDKAEDRVLSLTAPIEKIEPVRQRSLLGRLRDAISK